MRWLSERLEVRWNQRETVLPCSFAQLSVPAGKGEFLACCKGERPA